MDEQDGPDTVDDARTADPGPRGTSPTIAEPTRARLAAAERRRAIDEATAEPAGAARHAIGFSIGIAALAAAWRFLGAGRQ